MSAEGNTSNTDGITNIHHLHQGIIFLAQNILAHIQLHASGFILHIHEAGLAMATNSHHTTSHLYFCFCFSQSIKLVLHVGTTMSPLKSVAKGAPAVLFDFMHFINAVLHLLINLHICERCFFFYLVLVFCHALSSFLFYFQNLIGQFTCRSVSYNNIMDLLAQNSSTYRGFIGNLIIKGIGLGGTYNSIGFLFASFNIF